jgi:hypothetical protein
LTPAIFVEEEEYSHDQTLYVARMSAVRISYDVRPRGFSVPTPGHSECCVKSLIPYDIEMGDENPNVHNVIMQTTLHVFVLPDMDNAVWPMHFLKSSSTSNTPRFLDTPLNLAPVDCLTTDANIFHLVTPAQFPEVEQFTKLDLDRVKPCSAFSEPL